MNYFEPITKYYIINIIDCGNTKLQLDQTNLANYINQTFPILGVLNQEKRKALVNQDPDRLKQCSLLLSFAVNFLKLPRYLLVRGNSEMAIEPVSNKKVYSVNHELANRRVNDQELENYYLADYESLVDNFFNPSLETQSKATLSIEQLEEKRRLHQKQTRRKIKRYQKIK